MILQTVSINAAPRELHIKLFKVHGEEWEKLVQEIASLDAVALVSWARVFEAVKAPGVVAHWEVQHEIGGKAYTEQRILHASVKNPGCIQFYTVNLLDGHEELTETIRYEGKERKKAIEHFEKLRKEKVGVIFEKDIERHYWEK